MTTRDEHVRWCKQRALEELKFDGVMSAYASMTSDLRKHPETAHLVELCVRLGVAHLNSESDMRHFIEGFYSGEDQTEDEKLKEAEEKQLLEQQLVEAREKVKQMGEALAESESNG